MKSTYATKSTDATTGNQCCAQRDSRPVPPQSNHTLDPSNWQEFKSLAYQMIDDMTAHLSSLDAQPAWRQMPESVRESLHEPLPLSPQGAKKAYSDFVENVLPYP